MSSTFWQRQTPDKPLFPDLLWSRPEQRNAAGKLLVIGGNLHAFAAPAEAYVEANKAGAGLTRVLLPDAVKSLAGGLLETVDYAPSTRASGSFSRGALGELLEHAAWADAVLVAGDLGRNSETAVLLEKFIGKYTGSLTLTKDGVDYAITVPDTVLSRTDTLLVPSFAGLQKLAAKAGFAKAFTFSMDLLRFTEALHEFSEQNQAYIIVQHLNHIHCAVQGRIISTPLNQELPIWRVKTAAHATVWWLQNPSKPLKAFATAIYEMQK